MAAYLFGQLTVTNPELLGQYAEKAGPMVAKWGGEYVMHGAVHKVVEGSLPHQAGILIRFPDIESLTNWYHSEEYQAVAGMRHTASEGVVTFYEDMPD